MQARESLKTQEYFYERIAMKRQLDEKWSKKVSDGGVSTERVQAVKVDIAKSSLYILIAKYSCGFTSLDFAEDYSRALDFFCESWAGYWKLKNSNGEEYDQYTLSPYDEMLWMLSLGYLLNISDIEFKKLVSVIDQDKVKDKLYEFIISAKMKDRAPLMEESYREYFGVPQVFATLRLAIEQQNKKEAERLVKLFLEKEWYKNHKDAGWYNTHKSKHDVYVGYWCFESAAVVKIMGLDDSSFRDNKYYPKDLL